MGLLVYQESSLRLPVEEEPVAISAIHCGVLFEPVVETRDGNQQLTENATIHSPSDSDFVERDVLSASNNCPVFEIQVGTRTLQAFTECGDCSASLITFVGRDGSEKFYSPISPF